jgi:hypothetical protein
VANRRRICYRAELDEGRKRIILIAAAIWAARKLSSFDGGKRVPAMICAIDEAERLLYESAALPTELRRLMVG